ncbi:hypothetical protein [Rhodospirillum centenum]|uniref:Uncharacterized protein n=1 Tax=Rhodospirillum centenum (strain ATCC 51521 / SW) TaxID=414684 RepID=B6IRD1_RHOCS|nr:hypothetical protein [Rhodospirillum centenum]ACI98017.1 conserved hypothetical protein [Rhodospirillum centenum SW]
MRRPSLPVLLLGLPVLLAAAPASAQPVPPVAAVLGCLDLPDGPERLACFNRTVPALRAAVPPAASSGAVPRVGAVSAPPAAAPDQSFAAEQLPRATEPGAEPVRMTATVTEVGRDPSTGRLLVTLDNGQVWMQREAAAIRLKTGMSVTVKPGLFGSYAMVPEDGATMMKVRRVR